MVLPNFSATYSTYLDAVHVHTEQNRNHTLSSHLTKSNFMPLSTDHGVRGGHKSSLVGLDRDLKGGRQKCLSYLPIWNFISVGGLDMLHTEKELTFVHCYRRSIVSRQGSIRIVPGYRHMSCLHLRDTEMTYDEWPPAFYGIFLSATTSTSPC